MNSAEIKFQRLIRGGLPLYMESLGSALVTGFELVRMTYNKAYLSNMPSMYRDSKYLNSTLLTPDSPNFQLMENTGNIFDGYFIAMGTYHLLALISRNKISEKILLGSAFATSCAVIIGVKAGLAPMHGVVSDLKDIPSGVVGAALFVGSRLAGKKLEKIANEKNPLPSLSEAPKK